MIEVVTTAGQTLKLYSSIRELPIERSKKFYAALLQDVGIGNTVQDMDAHLERLMILASAGKTAETYEEAKNMRLGLFSALSGISFKSRALAQLVHGMEEDEALKACDGLTYAQTEDILMDVKKNLMRNGASPSLT